MIKILMTILVAFALLTVPNLSIAQPQSGEGGNQGKSNAPAPNPSAYEHANENAKFLRNTQDEEGQNGQERSKPERAVKGKEQGDRQEVDKDRGEAKKNRKAKEKSKESNVKHKDKSVSGKEKDKDKDKDKEQGQKSEELEVKY